MSSAENTPGAVASSENSWKVSIAASGVPDEIAVIVVSVWFRHSNGSCPEAGTYASVSTYMQS
eukprot:31995-Chlamydomonas_euryale.AAC.1